MAFESKDWAARKFGGFAINTYLITASVYEAPASESFETASGCHSYGRKT